MKSSLSPVWLGLTFLFFSSCTGTSFQSFYSGEQRQSGEAGDSSNSTSQGLSAELALKWPAPESTVEMREIRVEGNCVPGGGKVRYKGDFDFNDGNETDCSERGEFHFDLHLKKPHEKNYFKIGQGDSAIASWWLLERFAAYCGDGKVNQAWEITDDSESDATCKPKTMQKDPREGLVLARIHFFRYGNEGAGFVFPLAYVGQAERALPNGIYFPLKVGGEPVNDVPVREWGNTDGLSIGRRVVDGQMSLELFLYGNMGRTADSPKGYEHLSGSVQYYSSEETYDTLRIVNPPKDSLENQGNDKMSTSAGEDEVWKDPKTGITHFWMSVTVANDAVDLRVGP